MAINLDKEIEIPLGLLDRASFNPKSEIHGIYKRGLKTSLDTFGLDDRLKVFPNPSSKGRYIIINGNQRYSVLFEKLQEERIASHFKLVDPKPSDFSRILADPANATTIREIQQSILQTPIPVQVKTRLNKDEKFTIEHAKLYTATYDRNHARFDEAAQSNLLEGIHERANISKEIVERMCRPDKNFVMPASISEAKRKAEEVKSSVPVQDNAAGAPFDPEADEPWGSPPPDEQSPPATAGISGKQAKEPIILIPLLLSLTSEGHKEITDKVLRIKSRIFREKRLLAGLERLEKITDDTSGLTDSLVLELALRSLVVVIDSIDSDGV